MAITQETRWDNVGVEPGAGDAEYVAGDQPIAEYDNWFNKSASNDVENIIDVLENIATGHDHDGVNSKAVDGADVVNTPAGSISSVTVQAALNELDIEKSLIANITDMENQSFTNLLKNGDFESWSAGASAAPDGWISDAGTLLMETGILKNGLSSIKITNAGSYGRISHAIPNHVTYANKTITLQAWVKSTLSTAAIDIRDSDGHDLAYHSGSGNWELLTKTITVGATPSTLTVEMWIPSGTGDIAYFDGAMLVEGLVCPAFAPHPTDQIPIVITSAPTDAGINGETRWYAIAGAGGARRLYMSNGTDWKYVAIST